ncbi:hypothetical protein CERSUDRAFT_109700 [Gelatoporia subvermispora B]|uniref:Uncharacterized protein n=1 Tax=Ceriporiopsis subvermispora (strain B) TaxID=914234 RepID=M2QG33_CERS8|nr:hypothetical protein CERSUDRAFT_109700 [Gelatoporia subvermispora B]
MNHVRWMLNGGDHTHRRGSSARFHRTVPPRSERTEHNVEPAILRSFRSAQVLSCPNLISAGVCRHALKPTVQHRSVTVSKESGSINRPPFITQASDAVPALLRAAMFTCPWRNPSSPSSALS